ncbi:helix-turn-helix domain-containing protein [Paeniglutamicibacter sp. NPDC012692]|uniref:helix-turn-helix domain-containing protein n=1 Tax=Paeniglutamicibacter sp. NPDC012692 TaxID=3364388 RepID=UPI0036B82F3B
MNEDENWQRTIEILTHQVAEISENFLTRILVDPAYAESGLTMDDLGASSRKSFAAMLEALRTGGAEMAAVESIAAELGSKRARQGIPLESLVRAIRMDFTVLWEALSSPSLGVNPALLVRRTELVWRTVDAFAGKVQEWYRAELEDMELVDADLQQQYLTLLLATPEPSESDLMRIAGALTVDTDAEFVAAAISRDDSLLVKRRILGVRRKNDKIFTYDQGHHTLVIWQRRRGNQPSLDFDEKSLFEGVCAAVAPMASGFASVRKATVTAREIMSDLPMGSNGIHTLGDRWQSIARHRLAQVGCDPGQLVYPLLRRCTEAERNRLLEMAAVYLRTGSLLGTAAELHCHRNTIVNRLESFKRYTGLDLRLPADASVVLLALR